ncbi:MAG: tyrosine-protein phosphatase [Bacteroidales bacterium]|nr:tyrosine-protein phosphatase [Bacteroidales bacterium]
MRELPSGTRNVPFEGIENARDLGGLRMRGGNVIRKDMLIRSGELSRATDGDLKILSDRFMLSDIFDFRFDAEVESARDKVGDGVRYTRLSTLPEVLVNGFSDGRADSEKIKSEDFTAQLVSFAFNPKAQELSRQMYPLTVSDTTSQRLYGEFLRGVLKAEGGSLWHCSQGKDRAGWGTAFLLAALGAERGTIVEDFALSNISYAPVVEQLSEKVLQKGGGENELRFIRSMAGVSVENFERGLDLIDERFGGMDVYIEKALGFSSDMKKQLRIKYLE